MINPFRLVGAGVLATCETVGEIAVFAARAILRGVSGRIYLRQLVRQMIDIGYYSLPVVGLTAIFTGMVLALQSYTGFSRFEAESAVATIVVLSMTRELGPVLAGLMVAGRVGASMAAELGTMRVTEQIDALSTLSTDPFRYLIFPQAAGGHTDAAGAGADCRYHRRAWRLHRRRRQARLRAGRIYQPHHRVHGGRGRHLRAGQGGGVRFSRRPDGLLSGLQFGPRRPGCRHGHHQGRGLRLDPHPDRQLYRHRDLLQQVASSSDDEPARSSRSPSPA